MTQYAFFVPVIYMFVSCGTQSKPASKGPVIVSLSVVTRRYRYMRVQLEKKKEEEKRKSLIGQVMKFVSTVFVERPV